MDLDFEWNPAKAEASKATGNPLSVTIPDPEHSGREVRFLLLGRSAAGRLLVVAHTERGGRIRIINARLPNSRERRSYEQDSF